MTYTVGSLFSGIGGIDLAFEQAGYQIDWQVEIDDYCRQVLQRHWPDVPKLRDVRTVTGRTGKGWRRYNHVPRVDVLAGGFPCQDISAAGKGAGLDGTRSGLWFEFERLIGELRPRVVFMENVPAITFPGRGGTEVTAALAKMGYSASWGIISAADAGASHIRDRWWCVAYATGQGLPQWGHPGQPTSEAETGARLDTELERCSSVAYGVHQGGKKSRERSQPKNSGLGHANSAGLQSAWCCRGTRPANGRTQPAAIGTSAGTAEPGLGRTVDGLPARLDVARPGQPQHEWEAPRTVPARSVLNRGARLKALGNAVIPQVVYPLAVEISKMLEELDRRQQ